MTTKEDRLKSLDTAVERSGGIMKFAKVMGISHQAVYHWRKRGWVPADKALVIETVFAVPREALMEPGLVAVMTAPSAAADVL